MKKKIKLLFFIVFAFKISLSQIVIINSADTFFAINQGGNLCSSAIASSYCNPPSSSNFLFSSALHKDTLFYLATNSTLYRMKLNNPSSCTAMTTFAANNPFGVSINSLVVNKDGIVFAADGTTRELFQYNPYTNVKTLIGVLNVVPAGDLIFYKNKLLVSTFSNAIYEINMSDPSTSSVFIPTTGVLFYGLISIPFDCDKNKYYALEWWQSSTRLYELDMENRVVLGITCELPFLGYDGATNVDDGSTLGVTIDSINVKPACGNISAFAEIKIKASTASTGPLTYILDGSISNSNGVFNGVTLGTHTIRVVNIQNCSKDSIFSIYQGISPNFSITKTNPISCEQNNGNISINATSGYLPLTYSINGNGFQSNPVFNNLAGGIYTISIKDARNCQVDTVVTMTYQQYPSFLNSITVTPTICTAKSGSIQINLSAGINATDVQVTINSAPLVSSLLFPQLDSGQYTIGIVYQSNCRYDTIISINNTINQKPAIGLSVTDQQCLLNNGAVTISLSGNVSPYLLNFNNTGNSSILTFNGLPPGVYPIQISDKDGCLSDTTILISPYNLLPITSKKDTLNPTCKQLSGGKVAITINGAQLPYYFRFKNIVYNSGAIINGLTTGKYSFEILNADNCPIDTLEANLVLEISPECDYLYVPTAFTPNNNGLNDVFRVIAGEGIRDFDLTIYNRWGQLVFFTKDKSKGWDGKFKGVLQPNGVYIWMVNYKTISENDRKVKKGFVSLVY